MTKWLFPKNSRITINVFHNFKRRKTTKFSQQIQKASDLQNSTSIHDINLKQTKNTNFINLIKYNYKKPVFCLPLE